MEKPTPNLAKKSRATLLISLVGAKQSALLVYEPKIFFWPPSRRLRYQHVLALIHRDMRDRPLRGLF